MHNLHNDEYAREVTQPDKTKTQLVAIGGCGQAVCTDLILLHVCFFVKYIL